MYTENILHIYSCCSNSSQDLLSKLVSGYTGKSCMPVKKKSPKQMHNSGLLQLQERRTYQQKKIHLEAFGAGHSPDLRSKLLHCFCSLGESENDTDFIYSAEQLATNKMLPTLHFAGRTWAPSLQTVKFQVGSKEPANNQRGTCLMAWVRESKPAGLPAGASEKSTQNFMKNIIRCSNVSEFPSKLQPPRAKERKLLQAEERVGVGRRYYPNEKFRKFLPKQGLSIRMLVKDKNMIRFLPFPFMG